MSDKSRFKKENEYLDIHKTGIYKKNPVIIELETRDLLTYFSINDIKTAFTKKQKLQITDKGMYSISKPPLTRWICNTILDNIGFSKEYILNNMTITDGTAGIGGDLIYLSKFFKQVNGVELNKIHFSVLEHNLIDVLNLKNIKLYLNNYCNIYNKLKNDVVYLDPPWGGKKIYTQKDIMLSLGNYKIFNVINKLYECKVKYVFLKIPHNFNYFLFFHKVRYNEIRVFKNKKVWLLMVK